MAQVHDWTTEGATWAAQNGQLTAWVDGFLRGAGGNVPFADGLALRRRWWLGPIDFPLAPLERSCGPEENMPYREEEASWERHVARMADSLAAGWQPPPLIVRCEDGHLHVSDGNHRLEALKRRGERQFPALFWFDAAHDRDEFVASPHQGLRGEV